MGKTAIVIGAGIAGLATAKALAEKNYEVTVIERNQKAVGASIRNFGMIWPIGQPSGSLYETAILSREIWKQVCKDAGIWYEETGSLHMAYAEDEWQVMQEFYEGSHPERQCKLLSPGETLKCSEAVVKNGLIGSLWSSSELIVDPRQAIDMLPTWLAERYGVKFIWNKMVRAIAYPAVFLTGQTFIADEIYVCTGAEFETLYPELYTAAGITKCKLQMLRLASQPANWRIGPALCGALSLLHYKAFSSAPSLVNLKERMQDEYPAYLQWGIHVMVSQNQAGELTVGDSHEYGLTHDPFNKQFINQLIMDYLHGFARFKDMSITESWNGIYPKLPVNEPCLIIEPEPGVTIINGFGGAGMTLAFGICQQLIVGHPEAKALSHSFLKT